MFETVGCGLRGGFRGGVRVFERVERGRSTDNLAW